jgi:hypothetical protein
MVNARSRPRRPCAVWQGSGLIMRPRSTRVFCGFGGDAGGKGACSPQSETCIPGCQQQGQPLWCSPEEVHLSGNQEGTCYDRPWRPGPDLGTLFQRAANNGHYNEIILVRLAWARAPRRLPSGLTIACVCAPSCRTRSFGYYCSSARTGECHRVPCRAHLTLTRARARRTPMCLTQSRAYTTPQGSRRRPCRKHGARTPPSLVASILMLPKHRCLCSIEAIGRPRSERHERICDVHPPKTPPATPNFGPIRTFQNYPSE